MFPDLKRKGFGRNFGYCSAPEVCLPLLKVEEMSTIDCWDSILLVLIVPLGAPIAFFRSITSPRS